MQPHKHPHNNPARLERWLNSVWYGQHTPASLTRLGLRALGVVYKALRWATRQNSRAAAAKRPFQRRPLILVVGNLIAGGAGKTPVVMAVCKALTTRGHRVGIVSRGYGRKTDTVVVYTPGQQAPFDAAAVGDEPLFLARSTGRPIAVGARRAEALKALLSEHPALDVVVSDDGLQHAGLERHVEWVVFDRRGAGNRQLLPAGPLREPLGRLNTVDAVLCTQGTVEELAAQLNQVADDRWHAVDVRLTGFTQAASGQQVTIEAARSAWQGLSVTAFTGLGNPDKLFEAIRQSGINLSGCMGLPDHADYPENFCSTMHGDILLTSGKDAVKLPITDARLWVADIEVTLPAVLIDRLEEQLGLTTD
ncbi:MAG TPA: tetraacyldisaccharide 4'-kinase [Limnobacter sp.]|uniref:tetraacyldisaccharide 4'-kinase n=1 Tax=Limnobacter sp. TaxID=2003368 RepID=UPI002ED93D70